MSKRGRKRKAGKREPNGRLSRRKEYRPPTRAEAADNMAPALDVRRRIYGLTGKEIMDQRAENVLGRLNLTWERGDKACGISGEQYSAAVAYRDSYNAFQRAMCSRTDYQERRPPIEAGEEAFERFCRRAIAQWEGYRAAVREFTQAARSPNASEFLRLVVLQDRPAPHLTADGREILNVFVKLHEKGDKRGHDDSPSVHKYDSEGRTAVDKSARVVNMTS